ncbi:MAG: hypothetical protein JRM97_00960 [Nitrososphaerota archaeon]|nr:hypothetical protein [Nitrososphaerota archaeon]MDG6981550.1 hypothetical protein [Nitrososphaerota archaeon]MDG7031197.1 hypothetical protein [Nitrososphaerota archaeon]
MSNKSAFRMGTITRLLLLILIAVLAIRYTALVIIFFVPIAGWFIWRDHDRIVALEKRLEALKGPGAQEPEGH